MSSSDLELIETLRNLSKTQDLWAAGTAAGRLEDLLAVLREEACQCGQKLMINSEDHSVHCRYRQLVEPAKARRTKLDEWEHDLTHVDVNAKRKLLRLARAAVEEYKSQSKDIEEAIYDIDPRLVEDE